MHTDTISARIENLLVIFTRIALPDAPTDRELVLLAMIAAGRLLAELRGLELPEGHNGDKLAIEIAFGCRERRCRELIDSMKAPPQHDKKPTIGTRKP